MESGADLFGIGKGNAQVFEPIKANYADVYKMQEDRDAVRQKQESDVYKSLPSLNKIDILPQQQPIFAKKQQEIYDYARKNIDKLRKGDAAAMMDFQQQISKFQNDAAISKTLKEDYSRLLTPDTINKLSDDSIDYLDNYKGYDDATGQFVPLDPKQLKKKVDWVTHAQDHIKVNPVTRSVERYDPSTGQLNSSFTNKTPEAQLEQQMKDTLFGDDEVYSAVLSDYNKAVKKGTTEATDVFTFYKDRVKPGLMVDIQQFGTTKPSQDGLSVQGGGNSMKGKNFSFAYQNDPKRYTETISIARNDATENKPLDFVGDDGNPVYGRPVSYSRSAGGKWQLDVIDNNGDPIKINADKVASKMKANYEVTLDDLNPIIGKKAADVSKSTQKSNAVRVGQPKTGETTKVALGDGKGTGTAKWNGKKWELIK